ncbi:hypothetical protein [Alteromonas sp. CYL-A6]|uniref:hypothetical protein n=1 Tax=Alteromonas nitratireducens TaxID=3390813 RepID=UPI0034A75A37
MTPSDFVFTDYLQASDAMSAPAGSEHAAPVYFLNIRHAVNAATSERPVFGCHLTVNSELPVNQALLVGPDDTLGWLDHNRLDHLRVSTCDKSGKQPVEHFFCADDGRLRSRFPMHIYLLSNTSDTMKSDGWLLFSPVVSASASPLRLAVSN